MFHKLINQLENCQLKFSSEEKGVFEGYASTFDTVDQVGDTIIKGAFANTIASGRTVKGFVNHKQHEVPVIDWMSLIEDSHGLKVHGKVDMNHKDGPTVYSGLQRKAMDGLSIGFTMNPADFEQKAAGRIIKNLDLMEISVVSFPCERQATITAVKADLDGLITLSDYEDYLREVGGFSKSMATALVCQLVKRVRSDYETEKQQTAEQVSTNMLAIIQSLKTKL
jgi:HK97 family phage prohead protease